MCIKVTKTNSPTIPQFLVIGIPTPRNYIYDGFLMFASSILEKIL